jgi:hypothetical protein
VFEEISFFKLVDGAGCFSVPCEVVMTHHHCLGVACSTTGVDQGTALVDSNSSQSSFELIISQSFSSDHKILPANDTSIVRNAGVLNNFFEVGELISNAPDLVKLLLILNNQNAALAMFQNIFACICFIDLGLNRFDIVCILGFNSPEWHISYLGAIFAGGLSAGIYPTNGTCLIRVI